MYISPLTDPGLVWGYNTANSSKPEDPDVVRLLTVSVCLGFMESVLSLIFAYGAHLSGIFTGNYIVSTCTAKTQALIWVQMFIAAELLIFSTRAPSYFITSLMPSPALLVSVIMGCLVVSIMAGASTMFGAVPIEDILLAWAYDILGLFILDFIKVNLSVFLKCVIFFFLNLLLIQFPSFINHTQCNMKKLFLLLFD